MATLSFMFVDECLVNRCEAFNTLLKNYNVHSNRMASSRDIATRFSRLENLRFICSAGRYGLLASGANLSILPNLDAVVVFQEL